MNIFSIKHNKELFKLQMNDFSAEGDSFYGGAYFRGLAKISCSGFEATTSEFYFDNHSIKQFYEGLKHMYQAEKGSVSFESESKELKLKFQLQGNGEMNLTVCFDDLHSDDSLKCEILCHYSTIPNIKKELKDFLNIFKISN
ncbi:WapI family immunity protein [Priestia megaterium]|uniref:WapI family immunity protein n=1 Tax=Priestia megaterium TaxID=1404 RepID=UPI00077D7653|nr:hypothetical protein [Priestia megaterium]